MGEAMADPTEHVHSRSAYEMMDDFQIGQLGGTEKTVSEDWVPDPNFHPEDTDTLADFQRSKFIDLTRPLLAQVWRANFSKEFYLEQVHQPRHVKESARLFASDLLEPLTRTKWWVVPMIWVPITVFVGVLSLAQFSDRSVQSSLPLTSDHGSPITDEKRPHTQLDRVQRPPPSPLPSPTHFPRFLPPGPATQLDLLRPRKLRSLLRTRLCDLDHPRIHPPSVLVPPGFLLAG